MNTDVITAARRSERGLVLAGLLLAIGLSAMDGSIVATAVPSVVAALGGVTQFPWLFSAYLLASTVTIPLYGKLADQFGRKRLLIAGSAIFILGSAASGLAWNMPSLILFRAIQGIGAGALLPLAQTIAGDLYTVEERGRIQGVLASVWGISAVLGPLAGGLFTEFLTWRWIFFVNVPLGIAAIAVIAAFFHERPARRVVRTDYAGAALLVTGLGAVMLVLLEAGSAWGWSDARTVGIGACGVLVIGAFVLRERRADNPIFPLWILGNRTLACATLAMLVVGLMVLGVSAYLPTFAQSVFAATPIVAGGIFGLMSIAWASSAALSGRLYMKIGFRNTALVGSLFATCGALIFALIGPSSSIMLLPVGCAVMGFGCGLISSPMIVGAQSIVDWGRRGVVTGAVAFGQSLGGTVSAALMGSVFNTSLVRWITSAPVSLRPLLPTPDHAVEALRNSATHVASYVRQGLYLAVHRVDLGIFAAAAVGLGIVFLTPRKFEHIPTASRAEAPLDRAEGAREASSAV